MVVNIKNEPWDVYIGRNPKFGNTKWGNPYTHKSFNTSYAKYKVSSLEESLYMYEKHVMDSGLYDQLDELEDKILGCHCKPYPCHGDVLIKLINERKIINALE